MPRHKTIRRRDAVGAIKWYAPFIGLSDWHVSLSMDLPEAKGCVAEVRTTPSNERAWFHFCPKRLGSPKDYDGNETDWWDEFLTTVVHELIHARESTWTHIYDDKLQELMGEKEFSVWSSILYNLRDPATERLARSLVEHLPRYEREN